MKQIYLDTGTNEEEFGILHPIQVEELRYNQRRDEYILNYYDLYDGYYKFIFLKYKNKKFTSFLKTKFVDLDNIYYDYHPEGTFIPEFQEDKSIFNILAEKIFTQKVDVSILPPFILSSDCKYRKEELWYCPTRYNEQTKLFEPRQMIELQSYSNVLNDEIYTVSLGDTLDSISKKFCVNKKDIMNINNMNDEKVFFKQKIKIPTGCIYYYLEILYSKPYDNDFEYLATIYKISDKALNIPVIARHKTEKRIEDFFNFDDIYYLVLNNRKNINLSNVMKMRYLIKKCMENKYVMACMDKYDIDISIFTKITREILNSKDPVAESKRFLGYFNSNLTDYLIKNSEDKIKKIKKNND